MNSDHQPVVVWLRGEGRVGKRRGRKERRRAGRGNWTTEGREEFIQKFGKREGEERGI